MRKAAFALFVLALLNFSSVVQPADAAEPDAAAPSSYIDSEIAAARDWFTTLTPSGDALFDAYAQALVDKYGASGFSFEPFAPHFFVEDQLLAGWEPQFGHLPSYWELRVFNTDVFAIVLQSQVEDLQARDNQAGADALLAEADARFENQHILIETAMQRGLASSILLSRLCVEGLAQLRQSARKEAQSIAAQQGVGEVERQRQLDQLKARHYLGCDQLVARLRGMESAAPWGHYQQALLYFERGQDTEAWQSVEIGNSLPGRAWPAPGFPLSFVKDELQDERIPGSPVVAGAVQLSYSTFDLPVTERRAIHYVSGQASLSSDIPKLQALHTMVGRICIDSRYNTTEYMTWLTTWNGILRDTMVPHGDILSDAQRAELNSASGILRDCFGQLRVVTMEADPDDTFSYFEGPYSFDPGLAQRLPELRVFYDRCSQLQLVQVASCRAKPLERALAKNFLQPAEPGDFFAELRKRSQPEFSFELSEVLEDAAAAAAWDKMQAELLAKQEARMDTSTKQQTESADEPQP